MALMIAGLTSFQFHCHNLIHEDHEMMASMNVTALSDLGYDEKTSFIDPMEERYRAKSFGANDFSSRAGDFTDAAIEEKVKFFNNLDAYRNVGAVESRLEAYWKTASSGSVSSTTSSSAVVAASSTTLATSASSSVASGAAGSSTSAASATTTSAPAASVSTTAKTTAKATTSSTKKADDNTKKTTTTTKK